MIIPWSFTKYKGLKSVEVFSTIQKRKPVRGRNEDTHHPLDRAEESRRLVTEYGGLNVIRYRREGKQKQWFLCRNVVQVQVRRSFPGP